MIYFIQAGEDGPVKIGRAVNPVERLSVLQTGNWSDFRLRAALTVDDDTEVETSLHKMLSRYRIRGEWFRFNVVVNIALAQAQAGFLPTPHKLDQRLDDALPGRAGRDANRRDREKYNAYMKEYMKKRRASARVG